MKSFTIRRLWRVSWLDVNRRGVGTPIVKLIHRALEGELLEAYSDASSLGSPNELFRSVTATLSPFRSMACGHGIAIRWSEKGGAPDPTAQSNASRGN